MAPTHGALPGRGDALLHAVDDGNGGPGGDCLCGGFDNGVGGNDDGGMDNMNGFDAAPGDVVYWYSPDNYTNFSAVYGTATCGCACPY